MQVTVVYVQAVRMWTSASGSGEGPVTGSCEPGNEPSGSLKGEEFLD
jgi:hypothetical protein